MASNFRKSFFINVLISGGYNYLAQALTFFSSIIIARILTPSNYGLVGLITVFTGFISVFADSGISLAVIKSDYKLTYHKSLDTLSCVMGVCLCLITCLLAYPLSLFYDEQTILLPTIVLSTIFIFKCMSIVRGALLTKSLQFSYLGQVVLINTCVTIFCTIILAYYGFEHWSIIIPQIVGALVTTVLYEFKVGLGFKMYSFKYVKVAFVYTKKTIGSLLGFNLVNYWARNSDNLIVGRMYGINDLGIYTRAYSLLTLPLTLITGLMGTVLYPSLKKLKSEGGDILKEYLFVLSIIEIIVFPISFLLILFPKEIVNVLWGENWIQVSTLLPYFGLLIFSQPLLSTSGNLLVLQGKEKVLMLSGWVGATFMLIGIVLGAFISLVGIAQFYSLAFILLVLPFNIYYVFYKGLDFELKTLLFFWLPIIFISIGLWLACYFEILLLKYFLLFVLGLNIVINSRREIVKMSQIVRSKFFKFSVNNKV